jgi:hypothetical protein
MGGRREIRKENGVDVADVLVDCLGVAETFVARHAVLAIANHSRLVTEYIHRYYLYRWTGEC